MSITINPISPVAFSVSGFDVRWYALAYVAAFVVGFFLLRRMISEKNSGISLSKKQFDDLFTAVILGVIVGGRLGYVLFYNLSFFWAHPLEILAVWHGGMSFHGGVLGVIVSVVLFSMKIRKQSKETTHKSSPLLAFRSSLYILDIMAVVAPIGLFFGRIANFINMEVMGRITDKPWGVVFAGTGDIVPRHPSPLYEAATEGIALFIIMFCLWRFTGLRWRAGALSGIAAMIYAVFRIVCEQFREPDAQIGFLTSWGLTMGQLLSGIMFIVGATVFAIAFRKK
jgi:phosphatidylglycerol:prolipoprotein diacylglycerol transferase